MAVNLSVDTLSREDSRILMNVPALSARSVSPISPSRSEGHPQSQGSRLLSSMARRLGLKSSQGPVDYQPEDDSGCSTDSSSSGGMNNLGSHCSSINSNLTSHGDSSSNNFEEVSSSCSTDDRVKSFKNSSSSVHFRSTSSIRRALRSLSISTRSLSCTRDRSIGHDDDEDEDDEENFEYEKRVSFKTNSRETINSKKKPNSVISQRSKTPPPQRRILRQPVSYLYLKGMSGLPTQRVPRSSICCPQGYR